MKQNRSNAFIIVPDFGPKYCTDGIIFIIFDCFSLFSIIFDRFFIIFSSFSIGFFIIFDWSRYPNKASIEVGFPLFFCDFQ